MLSGQRAFPAPSRRSACAWLLTVAAAGCLGGCHAITSDVHQYYSQMAVNYKEAEDKARFQASMSESESSMLLKAGEIHKASRARKEAERLKEWADRCAHQKERFKKAAEKLEPPDDSTKGDQPEPAREADGTPGKP
ncbi:hypothetical protein OJF2_66850 [Aquisphaera giovannonii]|uniref:Uncharacterized protein n=1 Tax=Aquisphaera giovannonii TaxID=406548 RepID=A0A5B9WC39_9BACT|nr:hypothetical protein [Aquisphaera giovannonii]QEH38087.1 hypothetical protein OJF2_66850 [Aquisphaera giovannonii]